MSRRFRNTVVLAKIEANYGVDAAPTAGSDALLVSDAEFNVVYNTVDRDIVRGLFGASEQLAGTRWVECSFAVELAGSGVPGTPPAYGPLLRACGMAEVITPGDRVEYNPVSATLPSLTIHYLLDGVRHVALGCRGNVEIAMGEGERPLLKFSFVGLDGGISVQALPSPTLSAWRVPRAVTHLSSQAIRLGCTYANGALSGGASVASRGLQLNLGNNISRIALVGAQMADITQREVTGSVQFDLTAADEVSAYQAVADNTLISLGFEHGSAAGHRIILFAPAVQRTNPKRTDYEGRVLHSFDLRALPSAGNDDIRICVR